MSKIARATQKLFGSTAGTNQMAQFGSFAAATPMRYSGSTITPALVQNLSNYLEGWFAAIDGENAPTIEDMNALCYLFAYQLAYVLQTGVPEYDAGTTYFIGSIVTFSNALWVSITDTNLANTPVLTNQTNWARYGSKQRTVTSSGAVQATDNTVVFNTASGDLFGTLDALSTFAIGQKVTIKNSGFAGHAVTVSTNSGSEFIDNGSTTSMYLQSTSDGGEAVTLEKSTSTLWLQV